MSMNDVEEGNVGTTDREQWRSQNKVELMCAIGRLAATYDWKEWVYGLRMNLGSSFWA
jgi:hypothetical protein